MNEHDAIYQLYPDVKTINGNSDGSFTAFDIDMNEVSIDMSAVNTKLNEMIAEAEANKQAKADLKASAKAKLMSGEALTEDEANVMIGG
jgi:hypothetical protein